jgi:dTDP-4-dehydrorhamnose reductase
MKVLVTGVKGQLGHDVVRELDKRGHISCGVDIEDMDITDADSVEQRVLSIRPDAVIHCAAWTAVDAAEENIEKCTLVNITGTENISNACSKHDMKLIYISTDYVFNGQGDNLWNPSDIPQPINVYGLTKYGGELAVMHTVKKHFVVRISWAFGINGKNFVKTMVNLGKTKENITVVCDQIGSPTYTFDLARLLVDMLETEKYGIYHATNEGFCSWYEFACEIFRQTKMEHVKITPVTSDQFPTKANRPFNSKMSKDKLIENGFQRLPSWPDALKRYLIELGELH